MPSATLLLPARRRLGGDWPPPLARWLGMATRLPPGLPGERAQLLRHFHPLPQGWPAAALTRQLDVGDAEAGAWIRADPAWVRVEMTGARLFGCGEGIGMTQADVDAFLPALQPLFRDAGLALDAPAPSRWYLMAPRGTPLPRFVDPSEALGTDIFDHLPGGDDDGAAARHWRALSSEAQVVLHNHPRNAQRLESGRPPVNSLWFWGGGMFPESVSTAHADVLADDTMARSLAAAAPTASLRALPSRWSLPARATLIDLRSIRDMDDLASNWVLPAVGAMGEGSVASVMLDFEDGARFLLLRKHRWRFWRKPVRGDDTEAMTVAPGIGERE